MQREESRRTTPADAQGPWSAVRLRVRYVECDPMGVAHHSAVIPWLEIGRTELLRALGGSYADMEAGGVLLVVTRLGVTYRRPIRYDDLVEVRTRVAQAGRVKIRHEYEVGVVERGGRPADPASDAALPSDGVCIAAWTELACLDRAGRVRPLPDGLG